MAENWLFPADLIQLKQESIRTYNELSATPTAERRTELDQRLFHLSVRIGEHPYWRKHPRTPAARVALHRAAVAAPGGEPAVEKRVVDGRLITLPPGTGTEWQYPPAGR
ncbi:hypothetical protein OHA84_37950 (plasmid) [Streptomyces sp. NBC_00513]|uniref:hypothetical protein n=1 Tax=unclassified Streptomyces TaxID=2593676 RepID=UPI002251CDA7|nr:hypothetical protein [Streptomyces sp. NBC_00424]MCX5078764.1 hypothetical protein [Streptomyces sp. NBC_00424]WUD46314.1 hypothetical protein OHA84_37950 [Streptomyces sp. NBC_00513]